MMSLGLGAMIHGLSGGSQHDPNEYIGRTITAVEMADEKLRLTFSDGVKIDIFDDGQSCCETRYMRTDDDTALLVGHKLMHIVAKEAPDMDAEDDYGDHEIVFVEIGTDNGCVTLVNHNEHNGYYGGFGLTIQQVA